MTTRPYWSVTIQDNQEPLVRIPTQDFAAASIHDYQKLGAPYGETSPYAVREGVLASLYQAQAYLQKQQPHWRLYIFDAYRPLPVQEFMAHHAYQSLLHERGLDDVELTHSQQEALWQEVYTIWAPPNCNPLTPPPHSTGAAVDLTIFDTQTQICCDMGSPIDELSERSQPHYFAERLVQDNLSNPERELAKSAAHKRDILANAMEKAGFKRHLGEWWHFSLGDQMWVWLSQAQDAEIQVAHYGRYDLLAKDMV